MTHYAMPVEGEQRRGRDSGYLRYSEIDMVAFHPTGQARLAGAVLSADGVEVPPEEIIDNILRVRDAYLSVMPNRMALSPVAMRSVLQSRAVICTLGRQRGVTLFGLTFVPANDEHEPYDCWREED